MYSFYKQHFKQTLRNISPVGKEFTGQLIVKLFVFQGFTVVRIRPGNHKVKDFSPIIDEDMQLEAEKTIPSYFYPWMPIL
jgi:hypothetical protein